MSLKMPQSGSINKEQLVFHVDVNSAFLSWESVKRLREGGEDLRLIPAVIGGDPERRTSVVLAKSIPAKKYNITTGEPVSMALRKCPGLVVAHSDFKLYSECSHAFKKICRDYAPAVEEYSIDECFLDMTGTGRIYPDPVKTAIEIKEKIKNELGFTVNVGIGPNKLLAKMAGDFEKPDKVHTLFKEEIPKKMWPLPVGDLLYCGHASQEKLNSIRIYTIGDLAAADPLRVKRLLGEKLGAQLHDYANGIDDSVVSPEPEAPKGYSNEVTFEDDIVTFEQGERVLLFLADSVAGRARKDNAKGSCISVTVRGNDMKRRSHQKNLSTPTDITSEIYEVSRELLHEFWDGKRPLRLMGVSLSNIDRDGFSQMDLFASGKRSRQEAADRAVDAIREKFGRDMIKRASMMDSDITVGRKARGEEEAEK